MASAPNFCPLPAAIRPLLYRALHPGARLDVGCVGAELVVPPLDLADQIPIVDLAHDGQRPVPVLIAYERGQVVGEDRGQITEVVVIIGMLVRTPAPGGHFGVGGRCRSGPLLVHEAGLT